MTYRNQQIPPRFALEGTGFLADTGNDDVAQADHTAGSKQRIQPMHQIPRHAGRSPPRPACVRPPTLHRHRVLGGSPASPGGQFAPARNRTS